MRVIVLGGGVVGVTTAFFLLQDGHEVTLVERQPGVARECSHANGGFVAISQAVPWSAPGGPVKTLTTMTRPDAPILIHLRQVPRIWRWGLDFLRASRAEAVLGKHTGRAPARALQSRGAARRSGRQPASTTTGSRAAPSRSTRIRRASTRRS